VHHEISSPGIAGPAHYRVHPPSRRHVCRYISFGDGGLRRPTSHCEEFRRRDTPRELRAQVAFSDAALSSDGTTVGWLANYPNPDGSDPATDYIPQSLVIYRDGRVLSKFSTDQIFWDWKFLNADGGQVAYCTGPTHGGAAECSLHEVTTGRTVSRWLPSQNTNPPAWAKNLHY
jgi:hypothetical protein